MLKKTSPIFLIPLFLLFFAVASVSAQTEGIPLQTDVFLGSPIYGPEDLPEQITFNLYDSEDAFTPIGSQTFTRGQYTVDFEFMKSDGVTSGNVARVNAQFTNKLDLVDDFGESIKPKEIWTALEVAGTEVGTRTKVPDETMVQLLLASDASMATYLTLVYEGDDNPLTTIYKDLPISTLSSDGSATSLNSYFSSLAGDERDFGAADNWVDSGSGAWIPGRVGIGTSSPLRALHIYSEIQDNVAWFVSGDPKANFYFRDSLSVDGVLVGCAGDDLIFGGGGERARIDGNGNMGIGTKNPTYELAVNGTIRCKELIVDTDWSDFVFEDSYRLPSLFEVEQFIGENGHLPGIPTEVQVKENGVSVGDISSKLLQKIEELTLYVIDINKENAYLKKQIATIEAQLQEIQR